MGSVSLRAHVLAEASISSANINLGFGENPRGGSWSVPVKKTRRSHKVTTLSSSVMAVRSAKVEKHCDSI